MSASKQCGHRKRLPLRLRKVPGHFPARLANAPVAKWRVSASFKRKSPVSADRAFQLGLALEAASRSAVAAGQPMMRRSSSAHACLSSDRLRPIAG